MEIDVIFGFYQIKINLYTFINTNSRFLIDLLRKIQNINNEKYIVRIANQTLPHIQPSSFKKWRAEKYYKFNELIPWMSYRIFKK